MQRKACYLGVMMTKQMPTDEELSPCLDLALPIQELIGDRSSGSVAGKENDRRIYGVIIGRLIGLRDTGEPFVDFPGNTSATVLTARSVLALFQDQIGREILLSFEEGDPGKPVVMGFLESLAARQNPVKLKVDEDTLILEAQREIVLQCGKASITLTRAGKVLIRGAYLLSRSSGANRIKGGSVQIN